MRWCNQNAGSRAYYWWVVTHAAVFIWTAACLGLWLSILWTLGAKETKANGIWQAHCASLLTSPSASIPSPTPNPPLHLPSQGSHWRVNLFMFFLAQETPSAALHFQDQVQTLKLGHKPTISCAWQPTMLKSHKFAHRSLNNCCFFTPLCLCTNFPCLLVHSSWSSLVVLKVWSLDLRDNHIIRELVRDANPWAPPLTYWIRAWGPAMWVSGSPPGDSDTCFSLRTAN